jgi:chitin synthase
MLAIRFSLLLDRVPILVNPDIVAQYCETYVDTLHKKNLLLLGEDRYVFLSESSILLFSVPSSRS